MLIEVGKYYKTESGKKAFVAAFNQEAHVDHAYTGWLWADIVHSASWSASGRAHEGHNGPSDLVEFWREEDNPRLYAWVRVFGGDVLMNTISEPYGRMDAGWRRAPWLDEPEGGA